jgi:hypothetical protein
MTDVAMPPTNSWFGVRLLPGVLVRRLWGDREEL